MDDSVETRLSVTSRRDVIAVLSPEPKLIIFCSTDHPLPSLAFQSHSLFQIDPRDVLDDTLFTDSRNFATELRIRFDNEDAYTLVTEQPAGSLFVTYFRNSLALIREMTKHDTLLVEFNDGEAVDSFDLRGLSYQLSAYGRDCGV